MSFKYGIHVSPADTGQSAFISNEFMLWLWWMSDVNGSFYNFTSPDLLPEGEEASVLDELNGMDSVEIWIEDRIAMRHLDDTKVTNVMTGERLPEAPELKVAIATGKQIQEIRMGLRCSDREYFFGLKGANLELHGVKFPVVLCENAEEKVLDRMHLLEELESVIARMFTDFARLRTSTEWKTRVYPSIERWLDTGHGP